MDADLTTIAQDFVAAIVAADARRPQASGRHGVKATEFNRPYQRPGSRIFGLRRGSRHDFWPSTKGQPTRGGHSDTPLVVRLHIGGMGLSYVVMLTAFYVDNGKSLPVWRDLPHITYWLTPNVIGIPLIVRAVVRYTNASLP